MSSSAANAFARALSPTIESLAQVVISAQVGDRPPAPDADVQAVMTRLSNEMLHALHTKISHSRSVDAVIDCVPIDYRPRLKERLLSYAAWVDKMETVRTSFTRLEAVISTGAVPQRLRVSAPVFQFTKEFRESDDAAAVKAQTVFQEAATTFQTSVTSDARTTKKAELDWWVNRCAPETQAKAFEDDVNDEFTDREPTFKIPTIEYDASGTHSRLGPMVTSSQRIAERDVLIRASTLLMAQIVLIVQARHRALSKVIEKKKEVSAQADIEMADATKPGPSLQSLIQKTVNASMKKLELPTVAKKVSRSPLSRPTRANDYRNYTEFVWPEFVEGSHIHPLETVNIDLCDAKGPFYEGEPEAEGQEEGQGESFASGQRSQGQRRQRKGQGKRSSMTNTQVNPFRPSTLPDEVLTMSWDAAVSYVHTNTPLSILEAGQYRNYVHLSPNVVVPREISNDLSLGMKYMLFTSPLKSLLNESWHDFQRRLRWRIYFTFKEGLDRPFDPDYYVDDSKGVAGPKLPLWMEFGLIQGRKYVNQTISRIPESTIAEARKNAFAPKIENIRSFLIDNNYVITMTDKNLGLAVSERDWLIRNELTLLNDVRNYKRLSKFEADIIMSEKCMEMNDLASAVSDVPPLAALKVDKFFLSLITTGSEHVYPKFHGLPKIHKKPTGFRPIIPCHSVCFNPAAKFVSKELKPIIRSAPSIIHGTKDLFTRLSQLRIDSRKQWYFVTGDVVAFYPNIPLNLCMDIVSDMYNAWLFDHAEFDPNVDSYGSWREALKGKSKLFHMALRTGNTKLITEHHGTFFQQLNGLAMGVADSPDLANLFGYHFEKACGIMNDPTVPFYGRYIDDCFALVYAESADKALATVAEKVKFDGCVIEWMVSSTKCQFLDAELYKDRVNGLAWRPYVKVGNHRERIPWVSHHPIDVKRGVYVGECSRLAVLCSSKETYIGAIKDLNALYLIRGYPEPLVMSWCKKNLQERWDKRYAIRTQKEHSEGVLVLKTRFDDVWNWFSATELGNAVTGYWTEWLDRAEKGQFTNDPANLFRPYNPAEQHGIDDVLPDLFTEVSNGAGDTVFTPDLRKIGITGRRWLVSRKRNANLLDLANLWKKTVFEKLDNAIADEGGVDLAIPNVGPTNNRAPRIFIPTSLPEGHIDEPQDIIVGRRDSSDDEIDQVFGRMSKRTN
jgi:hypothetical protein